MEDVFDSQCINVKTTSNGDISVLAYGGKTPKVIINVSHCKALLFYRLRILGTTLTSMRDHGGDAYVNTLVYLQSDLSPTLID